MCQETFWLGWLFGMGVASLPLLWRLMDAMARSK